MPDTPDIHNILIIIGHRFGHQSGLDDLRFRTKFDKVSAWNRFPPLFDVFEHRQKSKILIDISKDRPF